MKIKSSRIRRIDSCSVHPRARLGPPRRIFRPLSVPLSSYASALALCGALVCSTGAARAATLYWDADGSSVGNSFSTGAGLGGTGTWDTATANWWNGTALAAWNNANTDSAVFWGAAGTVTLNTGITAGGVTFNTTGYSVAGQSLTLAAALGSASPVISVPNLGFGAGQITVSSLLAGTAGFTKIGDGALRLSNGSNSISGDLAIKGGSLVVSSGGQLGLGTTSISVSGFAGIGNPGFSGGSLVLDGTSLGFTVDREVSVAGRGPGAVNGSGGLVSVGSNTLAGGLTLASSTSDGRAIATHGNTTISGTLSIGSTNSSILYGNGNWIVSGRVAGTENVTDRFVKGGSLLSSTLWLQNSLNNFPGTIRIDSGTVRVSVPGALGIGTVTTGATGSVDLNVSSASGGMEIRSDLTNWSSIGFRVRSSGNGITLDHGIGTYGASSINQAMTFGNVTFDANSTLQVTGRNGINSSFTGASGTISWGTSNGMTWNNVGSGVMTINASISRATEVTARVLTLTATGEIVMTGNVLEPTQGTGSISVTKAGTGVMTLQGIAGTYTGSTSVNAGTLSISDVSAINSNSNAVSTGRLVLGGGTLNYTGGGQTWTNKVLLLSATNAILTSNGTGVLALPQNVANNNTGAKNLVLGGTIGTTSAPNDLQGFVANTTAGAGVTKFDSGVWQITSPGTTSATIGTANASFAVTANGTTAQQIITTTSTSGLVVGQPVSGGGLPYGTVITQIISATQFAVSQNFPASATGPLVLGTVSGSLASITPSANTANLITVSSTANLVVGQPIAGTGLAASAAWYVSAINSATTFTVANTTGTAAVGNSTVTGAQTLGLSSNFAGPLTITGGTVQLNPLAAAAASPVLSGLSNVIFAADTIRNNGYAGGVLNYKAHASGSTQTAGILSITGGAGTVQITPTAGTNTLTFGSFMSPLAVTANTANLLTVASTAGLTIGQPISGTGLTANAGWYVSAINSATTFTVANTTGASSLANSAAIGGQNYGVGAGLNFVVPTSPGTNTVVLSAGGSAGLLNAHAYYNGADFAYNPGGANAVLSAPVYGTTSGFTVTNTLTASTHVAIDAAASTGALAVNSLKVSGDTTLTLTGLLTVGGATGGGILVNGATTGASITGTGVTTASAGDLAIRVNGSTDVLTLSAPITATTTGGITKNGAGTLVLNAVNAGVAATISVNEGTLKLSGATTTLGASNMNLTLRQGTTFDVNGVNVAAANLVAGTATNSLNILAGAGTITNSNAATSTMTIGNGSGSGVFAGIIQDGVGKIAINKGGSGTETLTGLNTFTGPLTFTGGTIAVTSLANIGVASSIGKGDSTSTATNQASIRFASGSSGTILYTGASANVYQTTQTPSVSIDRLFTITGGATGTLDSSGQFGNNTAAASTANSAALIFNNTSAIAYTGSGTSTLGLAGTSIGDNQFSPLLSDANFALTKSGVGLWILTPGVSNTYGGATTISGGALQVAPQDAAVQGLSANSNLVLSGGVLQTSGSFTMTPGTAGGQVQFTGGGFAASTSKLSVNLGGASPVTINMGTAPSSGSTLILSSTTALADVDWQSPINLGTAARTIQVDDNASTGLDFATVSGVISGGAGGTLTKTGTGTLILGSGNTYVANTVLNNGSLIVTSIGSGGASSSLGAVGGTLQLGSGTNTPILFYVGSGETATRPVSFVGSTGTQTIDASGAGPLVLTSVTNSATGAFALQLRGTNTDSNSITSQLTNSGASVLTLTKTDGGVWVLNPSVANTFTGSITSSGGLLGLTANGIGSASGISLSNGGIFAYGGPLTTSKPLSVSVNTTGIIAGQNSITINADVTKVAGSNNSSTLSNNLEAGALLTINGNFVNPDTTNNQGLQIRGYGSTVWNGVIQNPPSTTSTFWNIAIDPSASFTTSGAANTYSGGTTLTDGILILDKSSGPLGASTGAFNFNGGTLRVGTTPASVTVANPVTIAGSPPKVDGTKSITFSGAVTMGASRTLQNELTGGATLILSGTVTNTAASTLTLFGTGTTSITGAVTTGTGAQGLAMSGTGALNLTGANNATGALTINRGTVTLGGASGVWSAGTFAVNAGGTLTLDNSSNNNSNRLADAGAFTLAGGGINFVGNTTTETAGALTVNSTDGILAMSGSGNNSLTFASVNFAHSGSSLQLAGILGLGVSNKLLFNSAPTLTPASTGILPRVFLGGGDFASYNSSNGVVAFTGYGSVTDINTAAATDTLKVTSSYTVDDLTASRTLNALAITDASSRDIGASGAATLTLTAGAVLASGAGTHTLSVPILSVGTNAFFQTANGTTLNLTGSITGGSTTLAKALPGTLQLSAKQWYGGATNVLEGTLVLNGGDNTLPPLAQALIVDPGATVDLKGSIQYVGSLSSGGGVLPGIGGSVTSSTNSGLLVSGATLSTWAGVISGSGVNFARTGGNVTMTLESAQSYGGTTTLMGGILTLENDATILNTSAIDINYAALSFSNNTSLQTQINNRVSDTAPITLRGGTITYTGRLSAPATETFGALTLAQGSSIITATTGAGTFSSVDLAFAGLTRSNNSTVNFTGTNLGQLGNNARIVFTSPVTVVNGGMLGSWAIANSTDYAAYNAGIGVGSVGQGGFVGYDGAFGTGNLTQIAAMANTTTTLSGTTNAGVLRLTGAFTNDIAFASASDTLNLESGGLLRSNENFSSSIGTAAIRGNLTSGAGELIAYNAQNTVTIHSVISGAIKLIKDGAGTLTLTAPNTYSLGTVLDRGTLNITPTNAGDVVIPSGDFIVNGGGQNAAATANLTVSDAIAATSALTLNGRGALTLSASVNQTLASVTLNNNGGDVAPTLTIGTGGILTLTSAAPVSASSSNAATTATITGGTVALAAGSNTFSIGPIAIGAQTYSTMQPTLNVASVMSGAGASITKSGNGLLQLSGANTFTGGLRTTGSSGGIILGGDTNITSLVAAGLGINTTAFVSGPVGTGTLTLGSGNALFTNDSARTIVNSVVFQGNLLFDNTATGTARVISLAGAVTTPDGAITISIPNPTVSASITGPVTNIGSLTSITKNGLGGLSLNITGIGSAVPITSNGGGTLGLLTDGNGSGGPETISLGALSYDASLPVITIGRAGQTTLWNQALNKTIAPSSFSGHLENGITLTNNNQYGLRLSDNVALSSTLGTATGPTFNIATASVSSVLQGLTLSGVLSGGNTGSSSVVLTKSGAGTLVLSNASNTFGGSGSAIDIVGGVLAASSDGALGNSSNSVLLDISASTGAGFRATNTFSSSRTFRLAQASNAIEVTDGNVLTLNAPFTLSATTNVLNKNDNGVLELAASNSATNWSVSGGGILVNAGAVRLSHNNAAGLSTNAILVNATSAAVGAAVQLAGGVTIPNPININPTATANTATGFNGFSGALENFSGTNATTGVISYNMDSSIGATAGVLNINGTINGTNTTPKILAFTGAGNINLNSGLTSATTTPNQIYSISKYGSGTLSFTTANAAILTNNLTAYAGTIAFSGNGSLLNAGGTGGIAATLNPGGMLTIDNSGTNLADRLGGRNVNLYGGSVNLIGNTAADSSESLGTPNFYRGYSVITVTAQTGRQANLIFFGSSNNPAPTQNSGASLTGASVLFRGTNLATTPTSGSATIIDSHSTNGFQFGGQSGATGTSSKGLMPWALVDTSATGNGISFATGDSANAVAFTTTYVRPLAASEYATANTFVAGNNINLTTGTTSTGSATLSINSLTMDGNAGVTIGSFLQLNSSSGGYLVKTGSSSSISGGIISQVGGSLGLSLWILGDLSISSLLTGGNGTSNGATGLVKAGTGTLTLSTPLSGIAGLTAMSANTISGQTVINQGTLKLNGGTNTFQANNYLEIGPGGTLDLNGNSQQVYGLYSDGIVPGSGGTITSSSGTGKLIVNVDNNVRNWAGSITGSVNFTRSGLQTFYFFGDNPYTGSTLLNANTTTLQHLGALSGTSSIAISYATLTLDNNYTANAGSFNNLTNRINDSASIILRGGTLNFSGRTNTISSETVGSVSVAQGFNQIVPTVNGTGIASADLTLASLSQSDTGATLNFNQSSLGLIGTNARVFISTLNGIATNSTTAGLGLINNLIGGWASAQNEFASYIPGLGVAALNAAGAPGYDAGVLLSGSHPAKNVRITSAGSIPNGGATYNSLVISGNIAFGFTTGTDTLNLVSGGLIAQQNTQSLGASVDSGRITAGGLSPSATSPLYIYNRANTVTINSRIIDNPNGSTSRVLLVLTANGGTIALTDTSNSYSGGTVLNGGTLNLLASTTGSVIPLANDPSKGLVINGGTVTMGSSTNTVAGQIASGNVVTLNGASSLTLLGNNTLAGLVLNNNGGSSIPTVTTYSTANATGAGSAGVLTIGSSGITATSSNVYSISLVEGLLDFGSGANTISVDSINVNGATDVTPLQGGLRLRGIIGSSGGITKSGSGVLELAAQESFTGAFTVSAGALKIGVANAGSRYSALTLNTGARLDLNGLSTTWGSLAGSGTVFNSTTTSTATGTLTAGFDNTSTVFSGQFARFNDAILGPTAFTKVGTGTLRLTGAQSYSAGSSGLITISGGTVAFDGSGAWFTGTSSPAFSTTFTVNSGGTLSLDNSSSTNLNNRLGMGTAGTLNIQGGKLAISGSSAAATTESITTFNVLNGGGRIELTPNAASALTLAITTLNSANSTGTLVIGGITGAASGAGVASVTITTPNLTTGQGAGVNGSTTMSVRQDILGDSSVSGYGTGLLTKDSVTGNYRALSSIELNSTVATWAGTQNAGLSSVQTISAATAANTLTISGTASLGSGLNATTFGDFNATGGLLTMSLSNATATLVLANATASINLGAYQATTAATTPFFHVLNGATLNLNAALATNGTGGIVKAGDGTLNLTKPAYYTGTTTLNGGTLQLNSGSANTLLVVPSAGAPSVGAVTINGPGSVLDLMGQSQTIGALSSTNALPGMSGTIQSTGGSALLTTVGTGTFSGVISGAIALTRAGNSTTTLTNASSYTGATTVRGGTLQLRDSGALSSTAGLVLNYGTLNWDNFGLNPSGTLNPTRIAAANPVTLLGGTLTINGAGSTTTDITLNSLTSSGGQNTISTLPYINEGSTVRLTIGNLVRSNSSRSGINFAGYSINNASTGSNTLGGQGLSTNSSVFLSQLNGSAFSASNLTNGLIGGWAVADGSTFATYSDLFGVVGMSLTYGGFTSTGFDGTDISAATVATGNYNDASSGITARTITAGSKLANSWRLSQTTADATFVLNSGAAITLGVGLITNSNKVVTLQGADSTSTLAGSGSDLYVYVNNGTTNINTKLTGGFALIKGGAGILGLGSSTIAASNDYSGGTYVQQGTLNLNATAGSIVIPGNLFINNAAVTMSTVAGQIASTSAVTLNGGGSLTFANFTTGPTQTLDSIAFNNEGGIAAPTVSLGTPTTATATYILSNASAITATNNSQAFTPVISTGAANLTALQFSNASPVITVNGGLAETGLAISARITQHVSMTSPLAKAGSGILALSGANIFTTGFNLNAGGLLFGADSTPTSGTVTSGPIGTGTLTIAGGTSVLSDSTARTIANAITVSGDFTFAGRTSGNNLTLSGAVALGSAGRTVTVSSPLVTGTLSGALTSTLSSGTALTKAGPGILVLSGSNNFSTAGVAVTGGILKLGNAAALGASNAAPIAISAGAGLDLAGFTLSAHPTVTGSGFVTNSGVSVTLVLGGSSATDLASNSGVSSIFGPALADAGSSNKISLTKSGLGTVTLANGGRHTGDTTMVAGTLALGSGASITSVGTLTFGASAGSTSISSLDLSGGSATFGALTVQTDSSSANTVLLGSTQTLRINGAVTVGYNSAAASSTKLTMTGPSATFTIGVAGTPTNANVQIGNGQTTNISNSATLDLSGLGTFYANLGTGTLRIGDPTNSGGAGSGGSTLILAGTSTILASAITQDSPTGTVTQALKLGSGTNTLWANTITIGGAANRAVGTLNFNSGSGSVTIRNLAGSGRADMNVQNGSSSDTGTLSGTVDFAGHSADLLLGALSIGGRSGLTTGSGTGTFSFDTGTLDVTTVVVASRTGNTATTGNVTGTLNLMQSGGTGIVTISTLNMGVNAAATATTSGRAIAALNIGGGTVGITTMTMANNSIGGGATAQSGSPVSSTVTVTGGATTVGTLNMNVNSSLNSGTSNASVSTLSISGGSFTVGIGGIVMANASAAPATATSTINITGTGSLTVGGNLGYTNGVGTENTTLNLSGGTLDMGGFSIGAAGALVGSGTGSITFASGTLKNVNEINNGAALTLGSSGNTLILEGSNRFTGAVSIPSGATLQIGTGSTTGNLGSASVPQAVTNNGVLVVNRSDAYTLGNAISGSGALTKQGGGVTTLTGANTFSGAVTVSGGTLAFSTSAQLGNASATNTIALNGGVLQSTGASVDLGTNRTLTLSASGGGLDVTSSNSFILSGTLSGSGVLSKSGSGTAVLSGTNSGYSGGINISSGTLSVASSANLGDASSTNSITLGGTLQTTGASVDLGTNRSLTVGSGGGALNVGASNALTLSGAIEGSGTLAKTGAGTLDITSTTGGFTGVVDANGGILQMTGTLGGTGGVTVTSGTLLLAGNERINNSASLTMAGGTFNVNGFSETLGTLTLSASSTIDLGANASASSVLIFGGAGSFANGQILSFTNFDVGTDRILFSNSVAGALGQIVINGAGVGEKQVIFGANSSVYYELTAVPEPSTWIGGGLLLGLLGLREMRTRRRRSGVND